MEQDVNDAGSVNSEAGSETGKKADTVSYESFDKLMKQHKGTQDRLAQLAKENETFKQLENERKEQGLIEEKKWEEVIQHKNNKLSVLEEKVDTLVSERDTAFKEMGDALKLQAVVEKLPGKLKKKDYYAFIDIDSINVDPETNNFDADSVMQVANGFLQNYSELIETKGGAKLPHDSAGSATQLSVDEWQRLPLKERKAKMAEVYRKTTGS